MQRFSAYSRILSSGAPAPSATVTVYTPPGTLNLASIFSDDGITPLANPLTTDSNGFFFLYAADGDYDIRLSGGGIVTPYTWGDVTLWSGAAGAHTWTGVQTFSTPIAVGSGGTGMDASGVTNGQLLIGHDANNNFSLAALTGTANQVVVTNGAGSITLSTPQSIGTGSSPTFTGLTLSDGLNVGFVAAIVADTVAVGDATCSLGNTTGLAPTLTFDTGDVFLFTRATNTFEWDIGGASRLILTSAGLLTGNGLIVGFSGTPVDDQIQVGDATFMLDYNTANPRVQYDTNDYFQYTRGTNTLDLVIGGGSEVIFTGSGVQIMNGLNVGFSASPADDTIEIGDASFQIAYNTANPQITFDTQDALAFTRGTNTLDVIIANVTEASFTAAGLAITDGLVVGFAGTPTADQIHVGDATFMLNYNTGNPRLQFDTGDYLTYTRASNILTLTANTAVLTMDFNTAPTPIQFGNATIGMVLQIANNAGGPGGSIQFRNAADSAWLTSIKTSTGNDLQLGDGTNDVQFMLPLVALGGGAAPTLGTIGGAGPAVAGQNTWARFLDSAGVAYFVPVWK